jgi:hypothetical protein
MKPYGWRNVELHAFLTSAPDGDEWFAPRSGCFMPKEGTPGAHWTAGWVDPKAGLAGGEEENLLTLPGIEHRFLDRQARSPSL